MAILPRYYYGDCYNSSYNCNSGWYGYGRWILLGCIIFVAILIFFLFSCITARRRRKMGYRPYPGTAWAAGTPAGHAPAQYMNPQYPQYNNSNNPAPPAYNAPNAGGYYNRDVELQHPENTYKPPAGPPPGRV